MMNNEMSAAFEFAKNEIKAILENCEKTKGKKFRVYVELMQTLTLLFQLGDTRLLTERTAEVCGRISIELGLSDADSMEALKIVKSFEKISKDLEVKLLLAKVSSMPSLN